VSGHVVAGLSAYLDGEVEAAERRAVEAHLQVCDECARHLEDLAAVDELARALPLEAPGGYFEALPARVRFKVTPRRRHALSLPAWSWAVAAGLIVAVVTPVLLRQNPKPAEVTRSVAPPPVPTSPAGRLDQNERPAASQPRESPGPATERRATASYDEVQSSPRKAAAPLPAAPAAPAPTGGAAQGTLKSNEAAAPLAKAEAAAPKDKARKSQAPDRTPDHQAASATFAAPPEPSPLEGAAGQHLVESETERDVADVAAAAPGESKRARSAAKSATAGMRDADAGRAEPRAPRLKFRALRAEVPGNAEDARRLREQWRAFVAQGPPASQADEGRVQIIERGIQAWRLSNDPADLTLVKSDAEAYLRREDAAQGDRVRSLLATTGN
jgi:anti-sigma factor RsiW